MIPKLIHQMWKDKNVGGYADGKIGARSQQSLKRDYPHCEYRLWTDPEIEKLVRTEFPFLISVFEQVSKIKRADIGRYAILQRFGGIYFDLDCLSLAPMPNVFENEFVGYKAWRRRTQNPRGWVLGNAFMATRAEHPLLNATLKSIARESHLSLHPLWHTGPERLDSVCCQIRSWNKVTVLHESEFGNSPAKRRRYGVHVRKHQW